MIAGGLILFLNGFFIRPNEKIIKTDKRNHIAMEIDVAYACLYKMPKEFKNTIRTIKLWRNWLMLLTFLAWFFGGAGLFI